MLEEPHLQCSQIEEPDLQCSEAGSPVLQSCGSLGGENQSRLNQFLLEL